MWEPHLEVSKVLLGLLDMASEADKWVPSQVYGLPLTPGNAFRDTFFLKIINRIGLIIKEVNPSLA